MGWSTTILICLLFASAAIATVNCNLEGDVLYAWKSKLADPYNVLESWDPTLVNPCTWFHVTCNADNSITRVDLGSAGLSGPLIPELQYLTNLQYLEVYNNSLSGSIPIEFGKLRALVSLDLFQNKLSGHIPSTLGNLMSLRFMRLRSNVLSGRITYKGHSTHSLGKFADHGLIRQHVGGKNPKHQFNRICHYKSSTRPKSSQVMKMILLI